MYPTDLVKAVYIYGNATLVLHRADGDTITSYLPCTMTISEVQTMVRDTHGLELEVQCETVFGLLKPGARV
jgi:hypothetical protein